MGFSFTIDDELEKFITMNGVEFARWKGPATGMWYVWVGDGLVGAYEDFPDTNKIWKDFVLRRMGLDEDVAEE